MGKGACVVFSRFEQTRPIMEYVRELENTVRVYRAQERHIHYWAFFSGAGAGALGMYFLLHYFFKGAL